MNVTRTRNGWTVESDRAKGVTYHVNYSPVLGFLVCDCPDYRIHRLSRGQICKHISAVWDAEKYDKKEKD